MIRRFLRWLHDGPLCLCIACRANVNACAPERRPGPVVYRRLRRGVVAPRLVYVRRAARRWGAPV